MWNAEWGTSALSPFPIPHSAFLIRAPLRPVVDRRLIATTGASESEAAFGTMIAADSSPAAPAVAQTVVLSLTSCRSGRCAPY
ncbi:hypothetical protein PLANPX_4953 [Lacipirellula parvula]|uniref:Uncharacterized protein n=1 Tax=Lacipirellula parvula TaxID=2650471 RepID=A0A5K7XJT4_9BACT|nr:hypothetical protein PLANPX_4953 [Lacipirellula parvula]